MDSSESSAVRALQAWFGNSQVVDEDGRPLVVYHGTNADIQEFDRSKTVDGGFHFGTSAQANMRASGQGKNLMPVFLSAEKLQRSKDLGGNWKSKIKSAKSAGKDGIVYLNRYEGLSSEVITRLSDAGLLSKLDRMSDAEFKRAVPEAQDSYIVFEPDQIKSAIGFTGKTFSENEFRFSLADEEELEPLLAPAHVAPFEAWFGDSKVVNADGTPRVMYHGTHTGVNPRNGQQIGDIEAFDRLATKRIFGRESLDQVGTWFSDSAGDDGAGKYTPTDVGAIYPVYLSIQNPWTVTFAGLWRQAQKQSGQPVGDRPNAKSVDAIRRWMKDNDIDGIRIIHEENAANGSTEFVNQDVWIALEPTQIKSAIGNSGEYSLGNPDIRYSEVDAVLADSVDVELPSVKASYIVLARETGRMLLSNRSDFVQEPGTWGAWSVAIDAEDDPGPSVLRELQAEVGLSQAAVLHPLFVNEQGTSRLHNYLVIVDQEFEPELSWESQGSSWVNLESLPQNLHTGLQAVFADQASLSVIQAGYGRSRALGVAGTSQFQSWFGGSQVVDAEGNPLVVYHGTNAHAYTGGEIETFYTRPDSGRGASFFSSDSGIARQYGEKVYSVYLRMEKPLIVDGAGGTWGTLSEKSLISGSVPDGLKAASRRDAEKLTKVFEELKDLLDDGDAVEAVPKIPVDAVDLNGLTLGDLPGVSGDGLETDTIVKAARGLGFDGVIFRNIQDSPTVDQGYKKTLSEVYAVFKPEQIKSAVANNGEFDLANSDIRFSEVDERPSTSVDADLDAQFDPKAEGAMAALQVRLRREIEGLTNAELQQAREVQLSIYHEFNKKDDRKSFFAVRRIWAIEAYTRDRDEEAEKLKPPVSDDDYRGQHQAPTMDGGAPLHDLCAEGIYPEDFYGPNGPRYYGIGDGSDARAMSLARHLRGMPRAKVTVYRAIPDTLKAKIVAGDWVTTDRRYAKDHGESSLNGKYKIIQKTVQARELFTNGDSIFEWGYDPRGKEKQLAPKVVAEASPDAGDSKAAFAKWFANSRVVDQDGQPLVVYHGTGIDITEFVPSEQGWYGSGIYFTDDPTVAEEFAFNHSEGQNLVPVHLSIQRPYFYREPAYYERDPSDEANFDMIRDVLPKAKANRLIAKMRREDHGYVGQELRDALVAMGHDGIIVESSTSHGSEYIVFEPSQIKSAIGNSGEFNKNNPDIRFSLPDDDSSNVESKFQEWFGNSKVVGVNGRPLVVYHGTQADFNVFDGERQGESVSGRGGDIGFFFTDDPEAASEHAMADWWRDDPQPNVMPVYLSIQNPEVIDNVGQPSRWYDNYGRDASLRALREGKDGLIIGSEGGVRLYIAFRPEQIKSAIANIGDFNAAVADIRFSLSDEKEDFLLKAWLGDSKVIDEAGEPLVMYHGQPRPEGDALTAFRSWGENDGIYFTSDPAYAGAYAVEFRAEHPDASFDDIDQTGVIYPVYLAIRNPLVLSGEDENQRSMYVSREYDRLELIAQGYDGVLLKYADGEIEAMAFHGNQVKSAVGNNGDFSYGSEDIRFSLEGGGQGPGQFDVLVDQALKPGADLRQQLHVGDVSGALKHLGIQSRPIYTSAKVIEKMRMDHGLTVAEIKSLPALLADPAMVFLSATQGGRYVMVTDVVRNGKPLVVALEPNGKVGRLDVVYVPSAYLKEDAGALERWIMAGMLKYAHKGKSQQLATTARLKLPGVVQQAIGFPVPKYITDQDLMQTTPSGASEQASKPVHDDLARGGGALDSRAAPGRRAAPKPKSTVAAVRGAISGMIGMDLPEGVGKFLVVTSDQISQDWIPAVGGNLLASFGIHAQAAGKQARHDNAASLLQAAARRQAQAFHDPVTGTTAFIADRINLGEEEAVCFHETVHQYGRSALGEAKWGTLVSGIKAWSNRDISTSERGIYEAAKRRATKSGVQGDIYDEELVAYGVEEAVKRGVRPSVLAVQGSAEAWLAAVVDSIRTIGAKLMANHVADVSMQDLVDLTYALAQLNSPERTAQIREALGDAEFVLWARDTDRADGNTLGSLRQGVAMGKSAGSIAPGM